MNWIWKVLVALFLAHGWVWTTLLKDKQLISEKQRLTILAFLGLVLLIQQIMINRPKPVDRSAVEKQRKIVENCLDSLLGEYRATLDAMGETDAWRTVRVNLSMLTSGWVPWRWQVKRYCRHLKIYYVACPRGLAYSDREWRAAWIKGSGAIGSAWKTGDVTVFDSQDQTFHAPAETVCDHLKSVVSGVNSVLAIPIVADGGKIVGVLALDSTLNLDKTRFHEPEVLKLAYAFANAVKPLCFFHGVS
jgi:transcriptional regulator with GAF, ATPase, and Fis domain